jgi:hypothetical protein
LFRTHFPSRELETERKTGSLSFPRLSLQNQKELLALLIEEIVYDPQKSKMKLTLRPLPDLGFQVEGDKVSFDERLNWLRD